MALQVWLPLNGDLNNRGLSDVSVTNNNAIINNNGKIGKCYGGGVTVTGINPVNLNGCSISFWTKTLSSSPSWEIIVSIKNSSGGQSHGIYFAESGRVKYEYNPSVNVYATTMDWHHYTFVISNGSSKGYVDGILSGSSTETVTSETFNSVGLGSSNVLINDVRIYDHCLSASEIKEISKGLVLHYPLNDGSITKNYVVGSEGFSYASCASGITVSRIENNSILKIVSSAGNGNWVRWSPLNESASSTSMSSITAGTKLTLSYDLFIESGSGIPSLFINSSYISFTGKPNLIGVWQRVRGVCYYDGPTSTYGYFTPHTGVSGLVGTFLLKNFKVETGDNPNPFWTRYEDESTVYDCSGYGNNGTIIGLIENSSENKRYSLSTNIPSSTTITHKRCLENGSNQEWTCCAWIKCSNVVSYSYMNNFNSSNGFRHGTYPLLYLNSGTNDYYNYGNKAIETDKWQHIAFVFKNGTISEQGTASNAIKLIYINGVQQTNLSGPNKTNTPSGIPDTVTLFGGGFEGLVSDYREYATALSSEDIQELYNTSAKISKNGTLFCYELKED